ncbi:MAG: SAM-dependent methyltransferase [Pseudonocardiaceae bacterium]
MRYAARWASRATAPEYHSGTDHDLCELPRPPPGAKAFPSTSVRRHPDSTFQFTAIRTCSFGAIPSSVQVILGETTLCSSRRRTLERVTRLSAPGLTTVAVSSPQHSQEIARFFDRVDLVEPGVVPVPLWRPDPNQIGTPTEVNTFGGVGRKP